MTYLKKKLLLGLFPILLLTQSCDPLYVANIENATSKDVEIELVFDKKILEHEWKDMPHRHHDFQSAINQSVKVLSVDTINLITNLLLIPNESFKLESGIGISPLFYYYENIIIYGKDTIVLDNKEKMTRAFKEMGKRQYNLKIE